jgi:ABC-type dipeptide/oligopeptide/nickel transport system permease component
MIQYIGRRIGIGILTTFFIATATFTAMHLVPGDPISGNKAMSAEIRANVEAKYGLDQPVFNQYLRFLNNMVHGDFGISFTQQNRSVNDIIWQHFPVSASLGLVAVFFAALFGIIHGSFAALYRNRFPDHVIMIGVILGISMPSFVFAALSQYGITELNKAMGQAILPVGWDENRGFTKFIIPSLVLGLSTMAFLTRLMRSSVLEVVNQDYIKTAKAKGLPPLRIFFSHIFRNSVLPVITYLGPAIAAITTGGFVVESVFSIPGLGRYFVQAVQQLDYTVIMGLTVFYGSFLVFMVILVDIIYCFIDPRIALSK